MTSSVGPLPSARTRSDAARLVRARRWEIEDFFLFLKEQLGLAHLYSFSAIGKEALLRLATGGVGPLLHAGGQREAGQRGARNSRGVLPAGAQGPAKTPRRADSMEAKHDLAHAMKPPMAAGETPTPPFKRAPLP